MNKFTTNLNNNKVSLGEKCDTCTDFQDWMSMNKTKPILNNNERPLFRDEYGRVAWTYLHTMAAYYPKEASKEQQTSMSQFITTFTEFFPCKECAEDFKDEIKKSPPQLGGRNELSQWFCEQHNIVNRKLDKKEFDCSKVLERWRLITKNNDK